jgi:hypothetical protein
VSFLLYCILRSRPWRQPPELIGVNGEHILFTTAQGLSGAVSRIVSSQLALNPSRILAYERIVARLHCRYTVIPMRYGCVLDEECRVVRLLEERGDRFSALLKQLEGCVEMGVRVLPGRNEAQGCEVQRGLWHPPVPSRHSAGPGCDYLAAQKLRYAQNEGFSAARKAFVDKVFAAFTGLFIKSKVEGRVSGTGKFMMPAPLFSLYFLVPAESVEVFRKRFHEINSEGAGLLLSGPWAPYNFVTS